MSTPQASAHTPGSATEPAVRLPFPFTALIGQPRLQLALQLAAIDPGIGGVLISGPRGTAKSTAARALAALLPGAPFVTLPLAASLEQVVGTLNVEDVLRDGQLRLAPGLVARAHGGVLYVDEVNLLADALVDALLDVAASGVNTVERDGISHQHAARFVLVGTMNPEEGDLRPQLLDRFGLSVTLDNPTDAPQRAAILRARLDFDADPAALIAQHAARQQALSAALITARAALPRLAWPDEVLRHAADRALHAGVDGLRADLVMLRAARALAALQARDAVTVADVDAVAEFALAHRRLDPSDLADANPLAHQAHQANHARAAERNAAGPQTRGPATATATTTASSAPGQPSQGAGPAEDHLSTAGHSGARSNPNPKPNGDWGALPAQPAGMVAAPRIAGWPAKKA
ncbi:ATP-binding protein [Hylemonella gracilis]|uniref:Magnesium chelatase n=1 Tax=Hylemonella gracilis ATCC 19624 TaxID=887062 RepID=F3KVU6_9BURK|nr:ATP-binding protein [Hylemonella gracilis]EGI76049.1 magnesium chelatase [Hylemonella gracilis ATCC 19624]